MSGLQQRVQDDPAAQPAGLPERPDEPSLSPSRAADFKTCPLLYRFRTIDRLPEPPSPAAVRGTLVHLVLERLFGLAAGQRTPQAAAGLVRPAWEDMLAEQPGLAALLGPSTSGPKVDPAADQDVSSRWLRDAETLVGRYFALEDPTRLRPAGLEVAVSAPLRSGLLLRGIIDRLDEAPDGALRVVDYKTGRAPDPLFERRAVFQLRCYALALWRSGRPIPAMLRLVYLADGQIVEDQPDEADLLTLERQLEAIWAAIERATEGQDWRPRRSSLCSFCPHQAMCPEFGGTPPPLPGHIEAPRG